MLSGKRCIQVELNTAFEALDMDGNGTLAHDEFRYCTPCAPYQRRSAAIPGTHSRCYGACHPQGWDAGAQPQAEQRADRDAQIEMLVHGTHGV